LIYSIISPKLLYQVKIFTIDFSKYLYYNYIMMEKGGENLADMGTKEAAELWGVTQRKVQDWCRKCNDARITQDKPRSPWHIPRDYPNPFN